MLKADRYRDNIFKYFFTSFYCMKKHSIQSDNDLLIYRETEKLFRELQAENRLIDTLKNENESESKYAKIKKFNKPNEKG